MQNENGKTRGVDRRAVIKGAAWAVPAIAVATAAPMASASNEKAGFDYAWYSCNNGTWFFEFKPKAGSGVTVTGVQVTSSFFGTNVPLSSGSKNGHSGWQIQANGSKDHFTTKPGACPRDHLVDDGTVFTVRYSDNTTDTFPASSIPAVIDMNNAQNCGTCGWVNDGTPSASVATYTGNKGKWSFEIESGLYDSNSQPVKIASVAMYTKWEPCTGGTPQAIKTWTSINNKTFSDDIDGLVYGGCGGKTWIMSHYNVAGTTPKAIMIADGTYFEITYVGGTTVTLNASQIATWEKDAEKTGGQ